MQYAPTEKRREPTAAEVVSILSCGAVRLRGKTEGSYQAVADQLALGGHSFGWYCHWLIRHRLRNRDIVLVRPNVVASTRFINEFNTQMACARRDWQVRMYMDRMRSEASVLDSFVVLRYAFYATERGSGFADSLLRDHSAGIFCEFIGLPFVRDCLSLTVEEALWTEMSFAGLLP